MLYKSANTLTSENHDKEIIVTGKQAKKIG